MLSMDHDSVGPDIQDHRIMSPFDGEALDYEFVYPETLPARSTLTAADTSSSSKRSGDRQLRI
jgi:hypothetical protein